MSAPAAATEASSFEDPSSGGEKTPSPPAPEPSHLSEESLIRKRLERSLNLITELCHKRCSRRNGAFNAGRRAKGSGAVFSQTRYAVVEAARNAIEKQQDKLRSVGMMAGTIIIDPGIHPGDTEQPDGEHSES